MKVVYLGCGEFGVPSLKALSRSPHELVHIFTHPPLPAGRGRKLTPTAVAQWASSANHDFTELPDINTPQAVEQVRSFSPELIVVIAFGQKVSRDVINIPRYKAINVHGSLLPAYRGAAPVNWAVINGDKETGVSIITLADKMDAGLIAATVSTPISPQDTAESVHDRLAEIAAPLLIETIDKIQAGTVRFIEQDHSKATRAPKLKKTDGYIDFNQPADVLCSRIRGLWSWPGAQCDFVSRQTGKCVRTTIVLVEVCGNSTGGFTPGSIDNDLNVVCGEGRIRILKIKPAGSRVMDWQDFVNGHHINTGDCFIKINP